MMTRVAAPDPPDGVRNLACQRYQAMAFAVALHREEFDTSAHAETAVTATATAIFQWLVGAVSLVIDFEPVVDQQTGKPVGYTLGGEMSQLRATDKVSGRVRTYDAKENEVLDDPGTDADNIRWSLLDGGEAFVTLTVHEDTRGFDLVAGSLGSTVLTAQIDTQDGVRTVTQAIDVIPGKVAAMVIEMGEPTPQDEPEPTPV